MARIPSIGMCMMTVFMPMLSRAVGVRSIGDLTIRGAGAGLIGAGVARGMPVGMTRGIGVPIGITIPIGDIRDRA